MNIIVSFISESLFSIGLDVAKAKLNAKLDERKLKSDLEEFFERESNFNELCSLAEEIDYEGLITFLREKCNDQIIIRVLEPNRDKRRKARSELINSAVRHSKANTNDSIKRVSRFVCLYIDLIRNFYYKKISIKDFVLANCITDSVAQQIHEASDKNTALIQSVENKLLSKIDNCGALVSIDKAISIARAGDISLLGEEFQNVINHVSMVHPIYPYYGYVFNNGHMLSTPLSGDAEKLFPPRIVLSGTLSFKNESLVVDMNDVFKYSYRHQIPIQMKINEAKKYLGEQLDPSQHEVTELIGNTVYVSPPEFPPAFPCSIKVIDKTYFDYILLRTQEINDDGTYIISNKEQNSCVYFEFHINFNDGLTISFKTRLSNTSSTTTREKLNYYSFIAALSRENDLHVYMLNASKDILSGSVNLDSVITNIDTINEEIDFYKRLLTIEDYFNVSLNTNDKIYNHDYELTVRLSDLINSEEVVLSWDKADFTGIIDQNFRNHIIDLGNEVHMLSFVGNKHIHLLGAEFDIRYLQIFKCAKLYDYDRTKRKAEVLDDGEQIKFSIIAGDDKTMIQTLKIPDCLINNDEKTEAEL